MKIDLSGKTALVTGSTAGIGHAIAKGLAGTGASVIVNGRGETKVNLRDDRREGTRHRCGRVDGRRLQGIDRGAARGGYPDQQCRDFCAKEFRRDPR
jgi:NAD(P)-dependent dehydrogenase (short-subunit alcohol dehydrogenase family)